MTCAPAVARSYETRRREAYEVLEQFVLEPLVVGHRMRLPAALVVPVAAGAASLRIIACREPLLREVAEPQIVGGAGPAHLRRHPSGVDRVAEHLRPRSRDQHRERRDE